MAESETIDKTELPATVDSIAADLLALGVTEGSLLLVHSSLRAMGWVSGGPVAVVEALLRAVGPSGTLVMPSHSTQLSEPSIWENPPVPESWWPVIRETVPAYDAQTTPTRCMGAIPEMFRTMPAAIRGDHPQWSFTAIGPLATEIVRPHLLEAGLGEDSPLGKIYSHGGSVLLMGVDHDRNTSLHLAEYRVFRGEVPEIKNGSPVFLESGERKWVEFDVPDIPDIDLLEVGESIKGSSGLVTAGKVACADCQLMSQPQLVDFAVEWMENH